MLKCKISNHDLTHFLDENVVEENDVLIEFAQCHFKDDINAEKN